MFGNLVKAYPPASAPPAGFIGYEVTQEASVFTTSHTQSRVIVLGLLISFFFPLKPGNEQHSLP